jgi:AcrR family transcriptional regulator
LADEAEVSRSTTYRNFSSPAAATDAFVDSFLTDFEAEVAALASDGPVEHLADICHAWAVLVEQHSQALVHVRSTEGFLSRVRRGDPIIGRIHGLMRSAIVEALAAGELPGSGSDSDSGSDTGSGPGSDPDYAVFLWNLLLDPRELLDLAEHRGETVTSAAEALTADFLSLLGSRGRRGQRGRR